MSAAAPTIQERVEQRRKKADLPLRTKLTAVSAVAALVLVIGSLGVFLVNEFRGSAELVAHTLQVQQNLSALLQRLTDAETGQRGLLLTGAEEFLGPYQGASADVNRALDTLRALTRDNPEQIKRVSNVDAIVKSRMLRLEARIKDFRAGIPLSLDTLRAGKVEMDSLRVLIGQMNKIEAGLLRERQTVLQKQGWIAIGVILPGTVIAFGLLMIITSAIRRDVAQREAAHQRIEEQNTELEAQAALLSDQQIELEHQLEESQVMTEELESTNEELQKITVIAEEEREAAEAARDQYRASEARYRFMADAIPVQVWTALPNGQLDFVSDGVAQYFGRTRDEMIGDGWLPVLHPEDISPVVEAWTHSLATGQPYDASFRVRRSDGVYRWHLGRAVALLDDDNQVVGWFGSNTDIDDRQRASEQRERLVRSLERTNQELDQFAYVASHDLKAPLRGIANLSEWIEEDVGEAFPAEAKEKMELLRGRVRRLEGLIDGILEYSRAGRARKAPSPIDVNQLVAEIIELQSPPESVKFEIAPQLPTVFSERVPLQQVLTNLIGNAIKYTRREDPVIRVDATLEGAFVHFRVTDNGPGIAPQYHERIFVVFQRLAARDKVEGTGIGLAIVKKVVEGRGGRVWVESPVADAVGTTFHFTWPREPGQED
ncbi:MAG: sensor histidine kinase [Gemmatimonas sp.]